MAPVTCQGSPSQQHHWEQQRAAGGGGCAGKRGLRGVGGGGPSAYRGPGAWCHCTEPTCRIWGLQEPRRWRSVSSARGPLGRPGAPWLASCPCICGQPRWRTAGRCRACPCKGRNFLSLVDPAAHPPPARRTRRASRPCGAAAGAHWPRAAAHGRTRLQLR